MFQGVVAFIAVVLTWSMFSSRNMMLGFPCAMFWGVLGAFYKTQSVVDADLNDILFFACMGMSFFSVLAMYGLRTKKQEIQDGDSFLDEKGADDRYFDEGKSSHRQADPSMEIAEAGDSMQFSAEERPSKKARGVRARAERRRTKGVLRKPDFGEFK